MKKHKKKPFVHITSPEIEEYTREMSSPESEEIEEVVRSSDEELQYIDMLSGRKVSQLLKILIQISGASRVLEIGTFTGYSALSMAEALPEGGVVYTIEMNERYLDLASKHFKKFDKDQKIRLIQGNAEVEIESIEEEFDLVFLDADKLRYKVYYDLVFPKVKQGGLIVIDNVLWDGTVLNPGDPKSRAIHETNQYIADDERVEQVMLPVRDGITVIRKI